MLFQKKKILVEKKKFTPLGPVLVIITSFILKLNHLFKSISTPKRRVFFFIGKLFFEFLMEVQDRQSEKVSLNNL